MKKALCLVLSLLMMTSAFVFAEAAVTETPTTILSFDSTNNFVKEFNATMAIETSVKTQGSGSMRFGFSIPTGQAANVGGMLFYDFTAAQNFSSYNKFAIDVYSPIAMEGKGGTLQINFVTASPAQDGINYNFDVGNLKAGWNTVSVDANAFTDSVNNTSMTSIKRFRITWFNHSQIACEFMLLDDFRGIVVSGTPDPEYAATAAAPYKVGNNLMINNADTLDGWNSKDMFNTTLSAGTQIAEGSGSVAMTATIPQGQSSNIGAMSVLNFPATDLSSYEKISVKVHLSALLAGSHQLQINFITGDNGDGYNYVYNNLGDSAAGWYTITFDRASVPQAVSTASWSSINRIRFTWFNHNQVATKAIFTFDEIMAIPAAAHVCTAGTTVQYDGTNHWYTCTGCGAVMNKAAHSGGAATCTAKATCSTCNQAYGSVNASNHAGGTEVRDAKSADCGNAGYTGDTYCKGCGAKTATGSTIPSTGNHGGGTATCTNKAVCSGCGQQYGSVNASNHVNTEIRNASATYTGDTYCKDCGTKIASGTTIGSTTSATGHTPYAVGSNLMINNADTLDGWDSKDMFNTTLAAGAQITEGKGSVMMSSTIPQGQSSNIGAMAKLTFPATNLSSYEQFSVKVYLGVAMTGTHQLQINFITGNDGDGYNYVHTFGDLPAGWLTITFNKADVPKALASADWASINAIRFTWFNHSQIASKATFTFDEIMAIPAESTSATGHDPYKVGDDLMINNADSLDGWDSKDMFNTTLSAGTQIAEGTGSVTITATIPVGQSANIGAMAVLNFPATDLSSYDKFSIKVYLGARLAGANQLQINFITGNGGDGYNYVYNNLGDSEPGWYTIIFDRASIAQADASANWASINRIRFTWFNHNQVDVKATFTIDEIKAVKEVHVCTAGTTVQYDGTNHWYTCTGCGAVMNKAAHAGGTATCTAKAVCSTCNQAYGSVDASNHAGGTEVRDAKSATCNTAGYTGDTYCKGCGVKTATGSTIPATGAHTGGEATCVSKAVCSVCSTEYGSLNASNHKHTEIRNQSATYTGDTYCADCDTKIASGESIVADVVATVGKVNGPVKAGDEVAISISIGQWTEAYAAIALEISYDSTLLELDGIEASVTDFAGALTAGGNKKFALIMAPSSDRQAEKLMGGEVCVVYFIALTDIDENTVVSANFTNVSVYTKGAEDNWVETKALKVGVENGGIVIPENEKNAPVASIDNVTNNVAASQDVTFKFEDESGIAGYYFGTSANYADNAYVDANATSLVKNITAAGTYYITVVDVFGNISETVAITFNMITLNANGGAVSVQNILVKAGSTIALPTATKAGSAFKGWATDADATEGVTSITVNADATYYATWEMTNYGDCTGEGEISSVDALYVLQAANGTRTLTEDQIARCDVNGDGQVTSVDALYILQFHVGTRTSFPVSK